MSTIIYSSSISSLSNFSNLSCNSSGTSSVFKSSSPISSSVLNKMLTTFSQINRAFLLFPQSFSHLWYSLRISYTPFPRRKSLLLRVAHNCDKHSSSIHRRSGSSSLFLSESKYCNFQSLITVILLNSYNHPHLELNGKLVVLFVIKLFWSSQK